MQKPTLEMSFYESLSEYDYASEASTVLDEMTKNGTIPSIDFVKISKINISHKIINECSFSTLDQPSVRVAFSFAYSFVFVCCCLGNLLLLIVVSVHPAMRTLTNFLLANIAVADLFVVSFCIIQNLMHLFVFEHAMWPLGEFMCRMYIFIMHAIPCTSAGLLLVLSCERYIAIKHPSIRRRLLTKGLLVASTGFIWSISLSTSRPYYTAASYSEYTEPKLGAKTWAWCGFKIDLNKGMIMFTFVFWYVVPLFIMVVIYLVIGVAMRRRTGNDAVAISSSGSVLRLRSQEAAEMNSNPIIRIDPPQNEQDIETVFLDQSPTDDWRKKSNDDKTCAREARRSLEIGKVDNGQQSSAGIDEEMVENQKRIIRLLVSIVLAFAVLTIPNHARLLLNPWMKPHVIAHRCNDGFQALIQPLSFLLQFSSSGINPILYALMSKEYRRAVRETFSLKALREQRR